MLLKTKKWAAVSSQQPGHRSKIGSEMVLNGGDYVASCTVQPEGIPEAPVPQEDIFGFLTKVPVEATPNTQSFKQ